jgi:D-alanine-D-alanine ligase
LGRKIPADISEEKSNEIRDLACRTFKAIGASGVVRIDFLYDENAGKIYVCEVNSIPGSLAYYFFKENKISTNYLVKKLVAIAEENRLNLSAVNKTYLTNILD